MKTDYDNNDYGIKILKKEENKRMIKLSITCLLFGMSSLQLINAQEIKMDFPKFSGKSYDFVIFQGVESKTVVQGVIPENGKFTIKIPKEYAPYKGMSRWLITGTREGGGLDMFVLGKDYTVSCQAPEPNEKNIVFKGNESYKALNDLYRQQEGIYKRYESMLFATKSFSASDKNYTLFQNELIAQKEAYSLFQNALEKRDDYVSRFLQIVNITRGRGTVLFEREVDEADNVANYIADRMDWETLYTSGHWSSVITTWVSIHGNILQDKDRFVNEFKLISSKIKDPEKYTDFVERVLYPLKEQNKSDYIVAITTCIKDSGKYNGNNLVLQNLKPNNRV
ncbi:alkyl hydroperoxide reductase [Elizabethkingia anophelis]|uniref:alkyl hydroperoxide reductase n=1 Tax=Elizabethkingia anophelis TaxID=1117645 RepID=UPI003207D8E1